MRLSDFHDEPRIIPSPERLVSRHVNGPFSLRAGNRNRQVRFTGRAIHVCVSSDKKSLRDRLAERFDYRRIQLGPRQGFFVNVSGFHRAEHDQGDRANKSDEQYC